jgi:phage terminase large subunit
MSNEIHFSYPGKFEPLIERRSRRKVAKGGRGSAKSESFGQLAVEETHTAKHRFLCCRELQNSIKESVHQTLKDIIYAKQLDKYYRITDTSIRSLRTGSEFLFRGIRNNPNEIKSLKGITRCWLEEGEGASASSLEVLIPTIRADDSEIWVSYNPETKDSPCDKTFITHAHPDSIIVDMNWRDNPWFPEVLRREKDLCKIVDYEKYLWIWEGQYKKYAHDLIFRDKIQCDCDFVTPDGVRFYYGLDFGFSNDPLSAHRMFEKQDGDFTDLYIDYEVYGLGIELDDMHKRLIEGLPGVLRNRLMADSARPDTISFLRRPFSKNGRTYPAIDCVGAEKKKGSLEDGIDYLRHYRHIYIHRRCPGAKEDYQNYRWKRDAKTDEILSEPVDKSNHTPDDNRYALEPLIKLKVSGFDVF